MNASRLKMCSNPAIALVALLALPLSAAGPAGTPLETGAGLVDVTERVGVVSVSRLGGGRELQLFANGASVVASEGTKVRFWSSGVEENEVILSMTPPDIDDPAAAAQEYRAAGRSVAQDAQALGISPADAAQIGIRYDEEEAANDSTSARSTGRQALGSIFASGCATVDNSYVYWHGCFTRTSGDSDSTYNYIGDQSQATGYAKNIHRLTRGRAKHEYNGANALIVRWQPIIDIPEGSCQQVTFGVSGYGLSLSDTFTLCPDKLHPSISDSVFESSWEGHSHGTKGVAAETLVRVKRGTSSGFTFHVSAAWTYL